MSAEILSQNTEKCRLIARPGVVAGCRPAQPPFLSNGNGNLKENGTYYGSIIINSDYESMRQGDKTRLLDDEESESESEDEIEKQIEKKLTEECYSIVCTPKIGSPKVSELKIKLANTVKMISRGASAVRKSLDLFRLGHALTDDIFICENAKKLSAILREEIDKLKIMHENETNPKLKSKLKKDIILYERQLKEVRLTRRAPCRTIKTTASVAGGWGAAIAGASAGAWAGAQTGTIIGAVFGPAGLAIAIPIGAVCGAIGLGLGTGIAGSKGAEFAAQKGLEFLDEKLSKNDPNPVTNVKNIETNAITTGETVCTPCF